MRILLSTIAIVFFSVNTLWAGSEKYTRILKGSEIPSKMALELKDGKFPLNGTAGAWMTDGGFKINDQNTFTDLVLMVEDNSDLYNEAFSVELHFSYEYKDKNHNEGPGSVSDVLSITYHPAADYKDRSVFRIPENAHWVKVTIDQLIVLDGQSNPISIPENVIFSINMDIDRVYDFDDDLTAANVDAVAYPSGATEGTEEAILVNWDFVPGAELYELEWTFADDYQLDQEGQPLTSGKDKSAVTYSFKNNSTRIKTAENYYKIPYVFERGYVIYRVRPIGRIEDNNSFEYLNGAWSLAVGSGPVGDLGTAFNYRVLEHEDAGKNWQHTASFAEEGKRKDVVSYFDGSLRSRGSVTNLSTENQALVGETYYDYHGRAAVTALPAPVYESGGTPGSKLRFYKGFNRNTETTPVPYSWLDFDKSSNPDGSCDVNDILGMSTQHGASKYYSPDNPDKEGAQAYVPDAQLFPFTQVEYMPDNTGRIRRQSGVGLDHKMNSGKETKYFYGVPLQEEIDRYFGSEVGDCRHYKKNMVEDANGQISISYLDMQGRVVATALAGESPTTMDILGSNTGAVQRSANMGLYNATNLQEGTLTSERKLLVNTEGTYDFDYEIIPNTFANDDFNGDPACSLDASICYDCVYDLKITIFDGCCTELVSHTQTIGQIDPFDSDCDIIQPVTVTAPLSVVLTTGSYTIRKELTLHEEATEYYKEKFIEQYACKTIDDFRKPIDFIGCDMTCEECDAEITAYIAQAAAEPAIWPALSPEEEAQMRLECKQICGGVNVCEAARRQMLLDVSPGGQYAEFLSQPPTSTTELVTNGTFDNGTGWTTGGGWTISSGQASYDGTGQSELYRTIVLSASTAYDLRFTLNNGPGSLTFVYDGKTIASATQTDEYFVSFTTDDDITDAVLRIFATGSGAFDIDNVSIKENTDEGDLVLNFESELSVLSNASGFPNMGSSRAYQTVQAADYKDADGTGSVVELGGGITKTPDELTPEEFVTHWRNSWAEALLQFHPEYCYLQWCEDNNIQGGTINGDANQPISSNGFDSLMYKTETYEDAFNLGLMNPRGLSVAPVNTTTYTTDGYFLSGGKGAGQASVFDDEIDDNFKGSVYSIWQYAAILAKCSHVLDDGAPSWGDLSACMNGHIFGDEPCLQDKEWEIFKSLYLSLKYEYQEEQRNDDAIAANCFNGCIGVGSATFDQSYYDEYGTEHAGEYTNSSQYCSQNTWDLYKDRSPRFGSPELNLGFNFDDPNFLTNGKTEAENRISEQCLAQCEAYASSWMEKLEGCSISVADAAALRAKLIEICGDGCDKDNPLGASSKAVEDVIGNELIANGDFFLTGSWQIGSDPAWTLTSGESGHAKYQYLWEISPPPADDWLQQSITLSPSTFYRLKFRLDNISGTGSIVVKYDNNILKTMVAEGEYSIGFWTDASVTSAYLRFEGDPGGGDDFSAEVDDISIYEAEPSSFEEALIHVLGNNPLSETCNPWLINMPLEYNHAYDKSYGKAPLDDCACSKIAEMEQQGCASLQELGMTYAEYNEASCACGLDPPGGCPDTYTGVMVPRSITCTPCVDCEKVQREKDQFELEFAGITGQERYDDMLTSWLNNRLNLNYSIFDYEDFLSQCAAGNDLTCEVFNNRAAELTDFLNAIAGKNEIVDEPVDVPLSRVPNYFGTELETYNLDNAVDIYKVNVIDPGIYIDFKSSTVTGNTWQLALTPVQATTEAALKEIVSFGDMEVKTAPADLEPELYAVQFTINGFTGDGQMVAFNGDMDFCPEAPCLPAFELASCSDCSNKIANADLSGGNTGFTNELTYVSTSPIDGNIPGEHYTMTTDATQEGTGWSGTDHTTGSGLFLAAWNKDKHIIWKQTNVSIVPNMDYEWTFWVNNLYADRYNDETVDQDVIRLEYRVDLDAQNYASVTDVIHDNNGVWTQYKLSFNSGSFNQVTLTIYSESLTLSVIDGSPIYEEHAIGLDDLSLQPAGCAPPAQLCLTPIVPEVNPTENCTETLQRFAEQNAQRAWFSYRDSLMAAFEAQYTAKCLKATENFTLSYPDNQYHHTLYYYDQAGNLIKTVPPQGIVPLSDEEIAMVQQHRADLTDPTVKGVNTYHTLATRYKYNSLNQLTHQTLPDHQPVTVWSETSSQTTFTGNVASMHVSPGGTIYAGGSGNEYGVIQSDDGGSTWSSPVWLPLPISAGNVNDIYCLSDEVCFAASIGIFRTTDGGQTWTEVFDADADPNISEVRKIEFASQQVGYAIADNGYLLTTDDGGATWTPLSLGTDELYDISCVSDNAAYVVGDNNATYKNNAPADPNNVNNWTGIRTTDPDIDLKAVYFVNAQLGFICGRYWDSEFFGALYKTTDGGATWSARSEPSGLNILKDVYFYNADKGYLLDDAGNIYKTYDGGLTWESELLGAGSSASGFEFYNGKLLIGGANGMIYTTTDEEHSGRFWYDRLGRLVVSQNAVQAAASTSAYIYSYTIYDELGRIVEVGELTQAQQITTAISMDDVQLGNWLSGASERREVTRTYYDNALFTVPAFTQDNLRNRVASVTITELRQPPFSSDDEAYNYATHYSYDIHGNVKALVQDNNSLEYTTDQSGNDMQRYKRMDYTYDLVSGNVLEVAYQKGELDEFYHRYEYDADNRITDVYTSSDGVIWDRDAKYDYYKHGPLARVELGEKQVQGIDYAYTVHGWLKGVNSNTLKTNRDIGKDGGTSAAGNEYLSANNTIHSKFAQDEYGFTLGYFGGDYRSIKNIPADNYLEASRTGSNFEANTNNLFNGNIGHTVTAIRELMGTEGPQGMAYHYDQLNRLTKAREFANLDVTNNAWLNDGNHDEDYGVDITYDANGNILSLKRNAYTKLDQNSNVVHDNKMDDLTYIYENRANGYNKNTNKLRQVTDNGDNTYAQASFGDIKAGQGVENYAYDAIGNLTQDIQEEIAAIEWNVYGKVKKVIRTTNVHEKPDLEFAYDANGNRIMKLNKPRHDGVLSYQDEWTYTFYTRDASGNIMSTYERSFTDNTTTWDDDYKLKEQHVYGSSRLGVRNTEKLLATETFESSGFDADGKFIRTNQSGFQPFNIDYVINNRTLGNKTYELANHLGSVAVTLSDRKVAVEDPLNPGAISHYEADVTSVLQTYPFGMPMPSRTFNLGDHRFGFNGMEQDNELKGNGNSYDFGARMYDPRLGRWTAVDPLSFKYPFASPYNFVLNKPTIAKDPDGRLVLFINGLRFWTATQDQRAGFWGKHLIYNRQTAGTLRDYWKTDEGEDNYFGNEVDMAQRYMDRIGDYNDYYLSGSSGWNSQADDRETEGAFKARMFHEMVQKGEIKLADDETIKIVSHSHGGAHSAGFAKELMKYKDENGAPLYKIEVIYYVTPHQPTDFEHPEGVRGVQYSHPNDQVSSRNYLPNGGSQFGRIPGVEGFDDRTIIDGGNILNRGGHNVYDNEFIFDIPQGRKTSVAPRKDNPGSSSTGGSQERTYTTERRPPRF